ncbi:MAG: M16 family metallopeptidase, partial [Deefgea sp.]
MKYFLQVALIAILPLSAFAAAEKIKLPPLIAAEVRHGELPNGLRYFIKANKQPAGKVEMRLLVNVGSLSETDDERGFAHLLEHMAFRRTKNFGPGQVQAFVESQGMRIGHDTNAFTYPEYTIYQLRVTSRQADMTLSLLADWATGGINFDANELATEKKI